MKNKFTSEYLIHLGKPTIYPDSPDKAVLDKVPNPHLDTKYLIRFIAPEFTSLCPLTNAPDFAHLIIDYIPKNFIIESKSLKLFLNSFRNYGSFHESCTILIGKKLIDFINPEWLRIGGYWYPRGGIPIDIFYQSGEKPECVWIPDQDIQRYIGRG